MRRMPEAEPAEGEAAPEPQPVQPLPDEELEVRQACYDSIFAEFGAIDLKEKSRAERKENEKQDIKSLTYSELDVPTMHQLLNKVKRDHGPLFESKGIFLDLGSGAGKACIAAGLLHPFQKVVGIECMQCLNSASTAAAAKYQEAQLPEGVIKPEVEFIQGDFVSEFEAKLEAIAPEVVVCLAVSTCFGEAELNAMGTMASKMPDESVFITFTQGLPESLVIDLDRNPAQRRCVAVKKALAKRGVEPSSVEINVEPPANDPFGWTLVHTERMQTLGGASTCFIYKKIVVPGLRPEPPAEETPPE